MTGQPREDSRCEPSSRPVLQFSLSSLFIVITILAMILSGFFGVGHLVGMPPSEVLMLFGAVNYLPTLIVWTVGLSIALSRLGTMRRQAVLAAVGLSGLILTTFTSQTAQMAAIGAMDRGWIGDAGFGWAMKAIEIGYVVVNAICWIPILAAIFVSRPEDPRQCNAQADSRDPFADE